MSAAPEERREVGDLDPAAVLALAESNEREIRERELLRLELAYHWAILHPAGRGLRPRSPRRRDGDLTGRGTHPDGRRHGPHPPAPEALETSKPPPDSRLAGRRVTQQTRHLPPEAAEWVDDRLATHATLGPKTLDRVVADAIARFDPAEHARREDRGKASWDVKLTHPGPTEFAGTSELWARGDTVALQALYDLISAQAHQRHLDGDTDPLGARKAKALAGLGTAEAPAGDKIKLYVRVGVDDLDQEAVGDVEKLGPATIAKIKEWVGHRRITIQPVLDPGRDDPVDTHDPSAWMRELVRLRDGHCVFPGCEVDARSCDLDHITTYDPNGPPGQTSPANLACLCRRHHRAKTARVWRYARTPEGHYLWHGPYGIRWLVALSGRCVHIPKWDAQGYDEWHEHSDRCAPPRRDGGLPGPDRGHRQGSQPGRARRGSGGARDASTGCRARRPGPA